MKKLLMLFTIMIFTISLGSSEALAQKGRGNGKGNGKMKEVQKDHNNNTDMGSVVLNRPVRRVYVTPSNRYGRRPIGVRHDNGKHKGWYKGKAKRGIL